MQVTSETFSDGETTPDVMVFNGFGLSGGNQSPQLSFIDAPERTRSFAVVCHDPDAPTSGGFYHWVFFNIPASVHELAQGADAQGIAGAVLGHNDYGKNAYGGMCPPPGPEHRYVFTAYALDVASLDLGPATTGAMLEFMLLEHTLSKATITGLYARP